MIRYIMIALLLCSYSNTHAASTPRIISVVVDPKGNAVIGRDTLEISDLAAELQKRLWKSYLGTGKMYDSIKVEFSGEVLMGTRGAAQDAVKLAQKNALIEVCLEKHNRLFENCNSAEQKKIRRQFPVLFQEI